MRGGQKRENAFVGMAWFTTAPTIGEPGSINGDIHHLANMARVSPLMDECIRQGPPKL